MKREQNGRFKQGQSYSPETQFQKGQHWRKPKPHWEREWLFDMYVTQAKSAKEISIQAGCTENNILYWLSKHQIPRRTISGARAAKHWGLSGEQNGMFGRAGKDSPAWSGGRTPERQKFYHSIKWKETVKAIWKRDRGYCVRCGDYNLNRRKMHIHHIVPFDQSKELKADISNLILLCAKCHNWVHQPMNIGNHFLLTYDEFKRKSK